MARSACGLALVAAACAMVGCSPGANTDQPAAPQSKPLPPVLSAPPETAAPPTASAPVAPPVTPPVTPPPAGKIAKDTLPAGLNPVTDAEAQEADAKCKPLGEAMKAAAAKDKGAAKAPIDFSLKFLANAPALKGIDVKRCADLITRDLLTYRAQTIESEAIRNLTQIALSMTSAYEKDPKQLCAAAPLTPSDPALVQDKAYVTKAEDWTADGWKCLKFAPLPAVRFQYEVKTDPKSLTYEAIARGYPVKGGPVSELYLQGKVGPGAPANPNPVMRR